MMMQLMLAVMNFALHSSQRQALHHRLLPSPPAANGAAQLRERQQQLLATLLCPCCIAAVQAGARIVGLQTRNQPDKDVTHQALTFSESAENVLGEQGRTSRAALYKFLPCVALILARCPRHHIPCNAKSERKKAACLQFHPPVAVVCPRYAAKKRSCLRLSKSRFLRRFYGRQSDSR